MAVALSHAVSIATTTSTNLFSNILEMELLKRGELCHISFTCRITVIVKLFCDYSKL